MILMKDIIREGNELLRKDSVDCVTPITEEDKKLVFSLLEYVLKSQDEEQCKKLGLRGAVGIAAPQIGINKKMFAIVCNDLDGKGNIICIINPSINKTSKDMVYLPGGEGCLSVDRSTSGVVPRYRAIKANGYVYNFKKNQFEYRKLELDDYVAIVFQHEYDHLFGTLFVDKIISEEEAKKRGIKPLWEDEK